MIKKIRTIGASATLATIMATNIALADFTVVPVRLSFKTGEAAVSLRVTHEDIGANKPGIYQGGVGEWTNPPNGRNVVNTNVITAFPPVFRLRPGETQIVRVSKVNKSDPMIGKAFRVIVREVPTPVKGQMNVAMRRVLNMPLLVQN